MVSFKLENMEATCGDHTNFIFDRGVNISLTPPPLLHTYCYKL